MEPAEVLTTAGRVCIIDRTISKGGSTASGSAAFSRAEKRAELYDLCAQALRGAMRRFRSRNGPERTVSTQFSLGS